MRDVVGTSQTQTQLKIALVQSVQLSRNPYNLKLGERPKSSRPQFQKLARGRGFVLDVFLLRDVVSVLCYARRIVWALLCRK